MLLGSRAEPLTELEALFASHASRWRYRRIEHATGRAGLILDQLVYRRALRDEQIDLVHEVHSFLPLLGARRRVVTIHDIMEEVFEEYAPRARSRRHRLHRWSVRHAADRILAISQSTADDVMRLWGIPADRIDVVPHGSRLEAVVATEMPPGMSPGGDAPWVLSPYNLEPRKNLAALVEALALLRAGGLDLRLVLYGRAAVDSARERAFEDLLAARKVEAAVRRVGFVDDATLAGLFGRATLFVFPSLYEGFGLPVLEAMLKGCCVIARNRSAMAEVVGDAGLLVETLEPRAIADAVSALLDDPERRRRLGEAAIERAATFTVDRMARGTWRVYARALGLEPNPT